jgi:putative ATP-binding cassette transporter
MTDASAAKPTAKGTGGPHFDVTQPSISRFISFSGGFWKGPSATTAWLLSAACLGLIFANLAVNVGLNRWNRWFFDAIEKKQGDQLPIAALAFLVLIALGAAFAVASTMSRMNLQVRWREWMTRELSERWLSDQRFYRLAITDDKQMNPEFRLAEDVRLATEPVVDFVTGFINAFLSAVTFASILFVVGGAITFTMFGSQVHIPGYLALAALVYAAVISTLTYTVGNPLVGKVERKNEAEAQYRYELTRLRENAESIALVKGDADERRRLESTFQRTVGRWMEVITQHCRLTWLLNANAFFAPVLPVLLAAPKYLAGQMSLGEVMQLAAAFTAVLGALNWFVDNYIRLAEWTASARRVDELYVALELVSIDDSLAKTGPIIIENSTDQTLNLENVSIVHRDGRVVIADADLTIQPGERVLLGGESGSGKSTLIRAIAGLWPWGEGRIKLPKAAHVAFVPQRPYIPLGRLRDALAYPHSGETLGTEQAIAAMKSAGLGYYADRLDKEDRWDQILSGGERQRIAFARLLINRPNVIVMDEATAALDVDSEYRLLTLLFSELPESTVISVGHREGLQELHTRQLTLQRHQTGARLSPGKLRQSWHRLKGVAGRIGKIGRRKVQMDETVEAAQALMESASEHPHPGRWRRVGSAAKRIVRLRRPRRGEPMDMTPDISQVVVTGLEAGDGPPIAAKSNGAGAAPPVSSP